jgi:hypothetical protein
LTRAEEQAVEGPLLWLSESMVKTMKSVLFCLLLLACPLLNGCGDAKSAVAPPPMQVSPSIQPLQIKACLGGGKPCEFDSPVTRGDLIVVVEIGSCVPGPTPVCDTVSDSQGNKWQTAVPGASNDNGILLRYVLNAPGGSDTVLFAAGTGWLAIIAEYPPSTGLEGASFGTYTFQNLGDDPNGGSSDTGWALPIKTAESCELLVSWGVSAAPLNGPWVPSPGPYFTMRIYDSGELALEDATTAIPGVYISSMQWNVYAHWDLGLAAFKMGGCK